MCACLYTCACVCVSSTMYVWVCVRTCACVCLEQDEHVRVRAHVPVCVEQAVREGGGKVPGKQRRFQAAWISLRAAEQTVPWGPQARLGVEMGARGAGMVGKCPRCVTYV